MLYKDTINVIGNGVVLHMPTLMRELEAFDKNNIDYEGQTSYLNTLSF